MTRDVFVKYGTATCIIILLVLTARWVIEGSFYWLDGVFSITGLIIFYVLYERLNMNRTALVLLGTALIVHTLGLYGNVYLGLGFDRYMHFYAGITIVYMVNLVYKVHGTLKRFFLLVAFSMGVGAFHEIIEWIGYSILGAGDGFLFYGTGDFGEWRNTALDLIFNLLGSTAMAAYLVNKR